MKLNVGAGDVQLDGYTQIDAKFGHDALKLEFADGAADEVYSSHMLEHLPHDQVRAALLEWYRVLKPGGRMRIAVPDFAKIAKAYIDGAEIPTALLVCGGQTDGRDFHKTLFDEAHLKQLMESVGLVNVKPFEAEFQDCSALPISLNLQGMKPVVVSLPRIHAVMSMPRLAFSDNMLSVTHTCARLGIALTKVTGAFYGQCLERGLSDGLHGFDYMLTIDYDTLFVPEDVIALAKLAMEHPEADAVAPVQVRRDMDSVLFTGIGDKDTARLTIKASDLCQPLYEVRSCHFGLTLIKVAALKDLPHPWFMPEPSPDGTWGENRIDEDVAFWLKFRAAGKRAFVAPSVVVGHAQLVASWPDQNMRTVFQYIPDYWKQGKPENVWNPQKRCEHENPISDREPLVQQGGHHQSGPAGSGAVRSPRRGRVRGQSDELDGGQGREAAG